MHKKRKLAVKNEAHDCVHLNVSIIIEPCRYAAMPLTVGTPSVLELGPVAISCQGIIFEWHPQPQLQ